MCRLPVAISGTITDASGRTMSGQTPEAFWHSLRHVRPVFFGLNCALGPKELRAHVATLSSVVDRPVSVYPNAGLPNAFGEYDESPEAMAEHIGAWAREGLVNVVGGCCGTTPEHIGAMRAAIDGVKPRHIPSVREACRLSGLEATTIDADSLFVNVGERTNVTGSACIQAPDRGQRLRRGVNRGASAGCQRRADYRHQYGRRPVGCASGDAALPAPGCR